MLVLKDIVTVFSKDSKPAGHAKDGDIITFHTVDCYNGRVQSEQDLFTTIEHGGGNPGTGPLYIEDAEPGDVIAVDILDIQVAEKGFASIIPNNGGIWEQCEPRTREFQIADGKVIWKGHDICWDLNPMIGVIGCAPADKEIPTVFAGDHGGNMDSNIIVKGATVWLPVRVKGALLCIGDLHATMADGEMCGNGIEIAGEVVARVRLVKNFELNWPVTETKDAYYVNTNGATCDEAIDRGYKEMARLLANAYGWDMSDIAIYMSVQGSLSANQACLTPGCGGNTFRVGTPKVMNKKRLIG